MTRREALFTVAPTVLRGAPRPAGDKPNCIVLRSSRRRYELDELVSAITPKNRHRETNWGKPVGRESCPPDCPSLCNPLN